MKELKKKASSGDTAAQLRLALCYHRGYGTFINKELAEKWFSAAAANGNETAEGYILHNGIGVKRDPAGAQKKFLADSKNSVDSLAMLGQTYINTDAAKAVKLFTEAKDKGSLGAIANLGYCYELGHSVPKSEKKAVELYTTAAMQGAVIAQYNLAMTLEFGKGCDQDTFKAFYWYKVAAYQNYPQAIRAVKAMLSSHPEYKSDLEWYIVRWLIVGNRKNPSSPLAAIPRDVITEIARCYVRAEYWFLKEIQE